MQTLENFTFTNTRTSRYQWETILDWHYHLLTRGGDYSCEDQTIVQMVRNQAKKRKVTVQVQKTAQGIVVKAGGPAVPASLPQVQAQEAPVAAPVPQGAPEAPKVAAPAQEKKGKGGKAA